MTALAALGRGLHDASLMALFGSACLLALLTVKVPELAFEGQGLALGRRIAALMALASAPIWLMGRPNAMSWMATTFAGRILLARFVLLVLLVAAVWLGRTRITAWLSGAGLGLIAATSHAAGASPRGFAPIGATNDGLHLLTAAYWVGGLCVLVAMLGERPKAARLQEAVALFAEWGMVAVALLVMTGMVNAAMVLLGSPGPDDVLYAGVLALKIILAFTMIGLALTNHFRLLPRLGQQGTATLLRNRAGWELRLGLAVIGLAALLNLLPPTYQ
ncbi:MAG TPA: CopD family protein [Rhizomicrobium sp.]|nr:CopD family protein [Rhizomicrobium sp.]